MKNKNSKIVFIILFACFIQSVWAQGNSELQSRLDSIKARLTLNKTENIEKAVQLNDYARLCFYNKKFIDGFRAAQDAYNISEKLNFEGGKVMYYLTLSAYHGNMDDDMNIYYQKQAQWLSKSIGNRLINYYEELEIPDIQYGYDLEHWNSEFQSILNYFKDSENKEIQANILIALARIGYASGNTEEMLEYYERIIKIFTDLDQIYPVFLFSTRKMIGLKNVDKTEEAKQIEISLIKSFVKNKDENAVGLIANTLASGYANSGRYLLAIEYYLKSIEVSENNGDHDMVGKNAFEMAVAYENLGLDSKAAESYLKAISELERYNDSTTINMVYGALVFPTIALEKYEEAKKYMALAIQDTINGQKKYLLARFNDASGQILKNQGNYKEAIPFFEKAMELFNQTGITWTAPFMPLYLTECHYNIGEYKIALKYGLQSLELEKSNNLNNTSVQKRASLWLSKTYKELNNIPEAYRYLQMHQNIIEESEKLDELNRVADMEVKAILDRSKREIESLEKERMLSEQKSRIQRLWIFIIAGALLSAILVTLILFRNNKNKQLANKLLKQQKEEIQTTLEQLEATQSQLIQAEKMASLGELTAGIAHEIQNPLNFVNNFSEINNELLDDLKEAITNNDQKEIEAIFKDLKENESKVTNHGKRAEAIVKGMLQHSRAETGEKEPTDINALCDEYLRLSYHGLRAKDKSFNAEFRLEADKNLPKINVVPQDIGRVLLNIINNAFYAVSKKHKSGMNEYKPMVVVSTKRLNENIELKVQDNGNGIPDSVKEKIFQPFFTTKPTGQGTGLGLSISYDIITKGYGGEIHVETKDKQGTGFRIILPIRS